jgi:hypothetical protein
VQGSRDRAQLAHFVGQHVAGSARGPVDHGLWP